MEAILKPARSLFRAREDGGREGDEAPELGFRFQEKIPVVENYLGASGSFLIDLVL